MGILGTLRAPVGIGVWPWARQDKPARNLRAGDGSGETKSGLAPLLERAARAAACNLFAKYDAALGKIVGRHFHFHAVTNN